MNEDRRGRVHTVYLEDLVDELAARVPSSDVSEHSDQFAERYLLRPD